MALRTRAIPTVGERYPSARAHAADARRLHCSRESINSLQALARLEASARRCPARARHCREAQGGCSLLHLLARAQTAGALPGRSRSEQNGLGDILERRTTGDRAEETSSERSRRRQTSEFGKASARFSLRRSPCSTRELLYSLLDSF